ncbi:MAG: redoxin domain-containing protein [Acidobacteriota bacterium]
MTLFQKAARLIAPILVAAGLVILAIVLPLMLSIQSSALGLWPLFLLVFGLVWLFFRSKLSAWFSPVAFLIVSMPLLVLLLGLYLILPSVAEVPVTASPYLDSQMDWIPEGEREPIDLSGTLQTLDGTEVSLKNFSDKALFLNIWATWCGPCRQEMPSMAVLYEKLSGQGLSVVAVTDEDPATVREFLSRNPYPFTVLIDTNQTLMERFQIYSLPTTFVIDSQDRLALHHIGAHDWDSDPVVNRFVQLMGQ